MKYRMTQFLLIGCLSATAFAAEQAVEEAKPHHNKLERLSKELGLTDDQQTKLKDLFKANKAKLKALREANRDQLDTTLTPEQKAKLEKLGQKRRALRDSKIKAGN